jgi:hypothetical protein
MREEKLFRHSAIHRRTGLGGPEYRRGGLRIEQHEAGGPVGQHRDGATRAQERRYDKKGNTTTKKKRKQRLRKRGYDYRHSDWERACMMTKKSAFVICYCFLLHLFQLCLSFVFPSLIEISSEAFVSTSMLLCVLERAGMRQGVVYYLSVLRVFEIDIPHLQLLKRSRPYRCLVMVP